MEAEPENCPGTQSEEAGKASACAGCPNQKICASAPKGPDPDIAVIAERMANVKRKILVLSGKGGVGKSTFSTQLSWFLAGLDLQVGLLDVDICGPSVPKMTGQEGMEVRQSGLGWTPVYPEDNFAVISVGFLLGSNPNQAVIWRGDKKTGLIKQFLKDVYWGDDLDFMIVDCPPGTSDEHLSITEVNGSLASPTRTVARHQQSRRRHHRDDTTGSGAPRRPQGATKHHAQLIPLRKSIFAAKLSFRSSELWRIWRASPVPSVTSAHPSSHLQLVVRLKWPPTWVSLSLVHYHWTQSC